MSSVYKIETYCESSAMMVESFIVSMGGKCVVQGSAVVTDYGFNSYHSLELLPFISVINDNVTDVDMNRWAEAC
ncbi:hypothetical protein L3Q72_19280 [Vibrio sp. JC009]|uniref:hypothetical protein n=1 Tax=Vibrio sp. JC009 TaxID=2912314 RepID=UPI0023B0D2AF|nr:hypothetical protein [Vibrio sp. JC009]WED23385.1 hypothetical protein L3Q72_19280 [Vibrio sp. JC009]